MGRWTQYDEDDYRLPSGFTRVGYDADTGQSFYSNKGGNVWSGAPHAQYGPLHPTGRTLQEDASEDEEPSPSEPTAQATDPLEEHSPSMEKEMVVREFNENNSNAIPPRSQTPGGRLIRRTKDLAKRIRSKSVSAVADRLGLTEASKPPYSSEYPIEKPKNVDVLTKSEKLHPTPPPAVRKAYSIRVPAGGYYDEDKKTSVSGSSSMHSSARKAYSIRVPVGESWRHDEDKKTLASRSSSMRSPVRKAYSIRVPVGEAWRHDEDKKTLASRSSSMHNSVTAVGSRASTLRSSNTISYSSRPHASVSRESSSRSDAPSSKQSPSTAASPPVSREASTRTSATASPRSTVPNSGQSQNKATSPTISRTLASTLSSESSTPTQPSPPPYPTQEPSRQRSHSSTQPQPRSNTEPSRKEELTRSSRSTRKGSPERRVHSHAGDTRKEGQISKDGKDGKKDEKKDNERGTRKEESSGQSSLKRSSTTARTTHTKSTSDDQSRSNEDVKDASRAVGTSRHRKSESVV